ncbi:MAG TPA: hypothetical protein VFC79_06970 [Tissierellaceae bacterium]|nr:hypothetical protein [Tissierellaceae bacterium]
MAVATMNTILKYKLEDEFVKLVDIKEYPDMGSEPEKIDTTTLSELRMRTSINGLQDAPDLAFMANYDKTAYELIDGLVGEQEFQLELGEDGVDGKFGWTGEVSVYLTGSGVNEVREMNISVSASTPILLVE